MCEIPTSDVIQLDGEEFHRIPGVDESWASKSGKIADSTWGRGVRVKSSGSLIQGRLTVCVKIDGKPRQRVAACLVWSAFHGSVPRGKKVVHRNGDERDNSLSNLYLQSGRPSNAGVKNRNCKLTTSQIREIAASPLENIVLAKQYGVTDGCVSHIRLGRTHSGVIDGVIKEPSSLQLGYLRHVLLYLKFPVSLINHISRSIDSNGNLRPDIRSVSRSMGVSLHMVKKFIGDAISHGVITKVGRGRYVCKIPSDDPSSAERFRLAWEDHLDSLVLTEYQIEILKLRIRSELMGDEYLEGIDNELTKDVSRDGTFKVRVNKRPGYSAWIISSTLGRLVEKGVVQRVDKWTMGFVDLPPRCKAGSGSRGASRKIKKQIEERENSVPLDHYRHSIELLVEGRMLDEVRSITMIDAKTLYQLQKSLQENRITNTLIAKGLPENELAKLLRLPIKATQALVCHLSSFKSSIDPINRR